MLGSKVMSFRFLMRQLKNASYEVKTPDVYRIEICGVFSGGRRRCVMIL